MSIRNREEGRLFVQTVMMFHFALESIRKIPKRSLLQILELRRALDAEIAELAAVRRTRDQMTAIKKALSAIDLASTEGGDAVAEDMEFHLAIAQATQNTFFFELIRMLGGAFHNGIAVTRANEGRAETLAIQTQTEHEAIMKAIAKRDPVAASNAARTHIEKASKRLLSADAAFWRERAMQVMR